MTNDELTAAFAKTWGPYQSAAKQIAQAGILADYYAFSYVLNALLSMAEATQDLSYLTTAIGLIKTMVDVSQPIPALPGKPVTGRAWGAENQLNYFKICQPIARCASIIRRYPAFASVGAAAGVFRSFVEDGIVGYWMTNHYGDTTTNGGIPFLSKTNGGWGAMSIWGDRTSLLGSILCHLYVTTMEQRYKDWAALIGKDFLGHTNTYGRRTLWDNDVLLSVWQTEGDDVKVSLGHQRAMPDTSHANTEAMFIHWMRDAGIGSLPDAISMGAAQNLKSYMWNPATQLVSNYIDGGNQPYRATLVPGGVGAIYSGWVLLGRWDPDVSAIGETILESILGGEVNPTLNYNAGVEGRLSLAANLLLNRSKPAALDFPTVAAPPVTPPPDLSVYRLQVTSAGVNGAQVHKKGGVIDTIQGGPAGKALMISLTVTQDTNLTANGNINKAAMLPAGSTIGLFWDGAGRWIPFG